MSTYSQILHALTKASVPLRELHGSGHVAATLNAGRVVAMAFSKDSPNLVWSNPLLDDAELVANTPNKLIGGLGGERLWLGPEFAYFWDGEPDWTTFANYTVPRATDPGAYEFVSHDAKSITLRARGELPVRGAGRHVGFELTRTIRLIEAPLPVDDPLMRGIDYVGIEEAHALVFTEHTRIGALDLWVVLQVPPGSLLIVPINESATADQRRPLSYALPGEWMEGDDHVRWTFGGTARAKFGLPVAALTGRAAVIQQIEPERWCLLIRQFPVDSNATYGDHPYGVPRRDQLLQAWDGFGFGELEIHSPVLDAERGARELKESNQLWAFGGSSHAIRALAIRLLGVDVGDLIRPSVFAR